MRVTFVRLNLVTEAKADETLLDAARRAGAPLGNSCGGVGVCNRCKVQVVEGAENLAPPTRMESTRVSGAERLACQAVVFGDCAVTTTYW